MRAERGVRSPLADSRVHTRSFGADHSTFAPIHAMVLGVLTLFCGSKRDRAGGCLAAQRRDLKAAAPSQVVRIPVSMNTGSRRPERALASGTRSRWAVATDSCSVSFLLGVRQAAPAPLGAFSLTVPDELPPFMAGQSRPKPRRGSMLTSSSCRPTAGRRTASGCRTGWTACVKADVTSVTGKPRGMQTYRIMIAEGVIQDRQRIEGEDTCAIESYEPV